METLAIVLAAIGAINWGLVGLHRFDLVAAITTAGKFGDTNAISRIIYVVVGIAGAMVLATSLSGSTLAVIAILLTGIGALNWGLIGLFGFDLVAAITTAGKFGDTNAISRIIYVVVGIAGVIALFS